MDLDASPLRSFLKVSETQSFTRAAEELSVSQPALSATIKELERRLGFALFERTSRRVSLTREGRAFQIYAKRVVLETDWMRRRAREIESNELRIAVQHHSVLIPERVNLTDGFLHHHSEANTQTLQLDHRRLYRAVEEEDADVALVIEPSDRTELSPLNPGSGPDIEAVPLAQRPLGLFVPRSHPLFDRDTLSTADLKEQEVISVNRVHGGAIATATARVLNDAGAQVVGMPEGDSLSVLRFVRQFDVPGIDLGWIQTEIGPGVRRIALMEFPAFSDLLILRLRKPPRPMADLFWDFALRKTGQVGP